MKNLLFAITGAIAAYKSVELIGKFKKAGWNVKVVVTPNALQFVTLTTLQTISGNKVYSQMFDENYSPVHISLADWADVMLVAPCSANTAAKFALGFCDNLLTSVFCAFKKPVLIAPCMNTGMWENPAVTRNFEILKERNVTVIEPEEGALACGTVGKGRLASLDVIFDATLCAVSDKKLVGKKIVVTAGGTREKIDPVRFIGNRSSGKTGVALADDAYFAGAEVVLISTFEVKKPYKTIKTDDAREMLEKVLEEFENADYLVMAAAVADYRVKNPSAQKIKKENNEILTLELEKNPDILKTMCGLKRNGQKVIGFCAESENLLENARKKLAEKKCDLIVANDISRANSGFDSDYNEVFVVGNGREIRVERALKTQIAAKLREIIYE